MKDTTHVFLCFPYLWELREIITLWYYIRDKCLRITEQCVSNYSVLAFWE